MAGQNQVEIRVVATGAEQAAKVLQGIGAAGAQIGSMTANGSRQAEAALTGLGATGKRVFEIFTGFTAANLFSHAIESVKAFTSEVAKLGLEAKVQEDAFARLSKSVGVAGDALVMQMNQAAGGILNTSDVMIAAAKALNQGLQPEQIVKLMEIARQQSKLAGIDVSEAFNQITNAIANQQPRALKQLGIVVDMDAAFKKHAATLGFEADRLTELGKTQAIYLAVAEQTKNSVAALTTEALTQSEQIQKLSGAWKQAKEDIGKVVVDAGFAVLKWLQQVKTDVGDITPLLQELGRVWGETWKNAKTALEPIVGMIGGFKPLVNGVMDAIATIGVGMNLVFTQLVGPITFVSLLLDDLANKRLPDMAAHGATVGKAMADANAKFEESVKALQRLRVEAAGAGAAGDVLGAGWTKVNDAMGKNKLGDVAGQIKALVPDLKALAAEAQRAALAMMKVTLGDASEELRMAQLLLDLKDADDRLKALSFTLGENGDKVQAEANDMREWQEAVDRVAEALKNLIPLSDAVPAFGGADFTKNLIDMNRELQALKATSDLDAEALRKFGVSFDLLDEETKAALLSLREWRAETEAISGSKKFEETMAGINQQARLMGASFDALRPSIAALEAEIIRLEKAGQDVTALQEKLVSLKQVQELKGIFSDVFASIGSAVNTSVQGMILGTTTLAKAWSNLWQSIVASFVNSGIQRLLKGLQDWLWDFFSGTSSGVSGSGIFGAIVSGAGALVAKLSGGGTSLGNPIGSSASALDQVTTAAKGTASALNAANTGVSNFSAGVGAALSGLGVAAGIYGLTQGGSPASMAFSAGGTALSLYSLAVSASQLAVNAGLIGTALPTIGVLLAQGLATVAPTIAAAVGTAVYTAFGSSAVTTALLGGGAAAAGGAAAGGAGVGAALGASAGASFLGFVAFMVAGGLAGIAADAEDAAESFKEQLGAVKDALNQAGAAGLLFANLGKSLQESNLAKSLEQLHGALRALGDLDLAVGLNQVIGDASSQGIMAQVPKLRATVGAAWLAAMDAAVAKGMPIPTASPGRDLTAPWAGAVGMQSFDDILAQAAGAGRDGFDKLTNLLEHISQSLDTSLYQVNATGVRMVDLGAVNALLDKEFLTTSLRNAVVDIGALFGISAGQLGGIGAGEGNWRGTPGAGNMPSMAAIASAQAALEAAGFEPGKYAEALEKYLTSIDTNLVNNPAWKKFVDMLHKAGGDTGVVAAINAALGKNMTPMQFYGVAKAATDSLTAALKEQMTARASETDTDALKAIDDSIAAMTETVKAWSSLVTLYTVLPVEMAAIAGDLGKQTAASIDAWRVQMQSFTDAIADSRKELDKAIAGGNITSIAAAAQAVHDQTIAQYNAVVKAVESIHQAIQGILEQAGILVDMMTSVAQLDIRSNGSFATIGSLLGSLQDIAEHGGTAAIRLFAVNKAIEAIIATLPTAIEKFGSEGGAGAITGAVTGAARPFLAAQQGAINQAQGAAQLALLQQQAQTINALASAVIAGIQQALSAALKAVRETADATIAGLTRERDAKLKAIDDEIGGIETEAARRHELHTQEIEAIQGVAKLYHDKAMAEIAAIETTAKAAHESRMAEIDAIQEAEDAAHEYRAAEMDALSELINKAQEMESAVEGMGKFIDALKKGPLGPGNPADKLSMAQQSFAQALTAFNRNPTAGGLTDLQDLAQTMLSQAEPILSKPSPAFQALSANTIKQLMAAQALAAAQMTDSQILKAQLEHLQAIDKATSASVGEQIKAIQDADEAAGRKADAMIEAIRKRDEREQAQAAALIKGIEDLDKSEQAQAKELIGKLNENREQVTKDFETQTTAIEAALKAQIAAIEKAANEEIDHVQKGTAAALQANMQAQIPLLQAQFDAANAQLAAIGDTKQWQTDTITKLEAIRVLLATAIPAETGMARVTEGLYHLHDDEMVLPRGVANRIRSAAMGAGMPDETGRAVGEIIANWDNYSATEQQNIIAAYNAADDATRQSADRAASFWQASEAQTARAATRPPDLSNTGPWAPGSGDPLRDPWMAHAVQTKAGDWIYEPGYGPGATPGSVVKFGTGSTPGTSPSGTAPTAPYLPPGPPWLYRGAGGTTLAAGGSLAYGGGSPDGGGPITVVVKLDGKTIGEATLPTIQGDARSGKMRTIILETKAR